MPSEGAGPLTYDFEFFGPSGTVTVDTAYSLSFSGDPQLSGEEVCITDHTQGSLKGTLVDTLNANQVYEIDLEALFQVSGGVTGVNPHVFIDPFISIDPTDPSFGTNTYSLLLGSGVGNSQASTTPEPTSMGLIAAGLGVIAAIRLRRNSPR